MDRILNNAYEAYCRVYGNKGYSISADIHNIDELYAEIVITYVSRLCKLGLYKEYKSVENVELSAPRGTINIAKTINRQSMSKGKVVCSYSELTENNYINKITKALIENIERRSISEKYKKDIMQLKRKFNNVESIKLKDISLTNVRYNNTTLRYRPLVKLAGIIKEEAILEHYEEITEDDKIYTIYKDSINGYIRKAFKDDDISIDNIYMDRVKGIYSNVDTYGKNSYKLLAIRNKQKGVILSILKNDEKLCGDSLAIREQIENMSKAMSKYKNEYRVRLTGYIMYINCNKKINTIAKSRRAVCNGNIIISDNINFSDEMRICDHMICSSIERGLMK